MKYTAEQSKYLVDQYNQAAASPSFQEELAAAGGPYHPIITSLANEFSVSERSIVAKLASLGAYKRKVYLNKQGQEPVKKEIYVERIAKLLNVQLDRLESLEKANKSVLILIERALSAE